MRNFLILVFAFFGLLILSGQSAHAQCASQANVVVKTHTNVSCFGANDGTITVDITDAALGLPYNFELIDLSVPAIVTPSVTETEDKPTRSVVYTNVPPGTYAVALFKSGCTTLQITETPFGFEVLEPTEIIASSTVAPDCNGAVGVGTGKIDISITGGSGVYSSIIWTGPTSISPGTTSTLANLDAGNYSVTITDNTGCPITENFTVPITTPADAGPPTGVTCGTNSFALSGNAFGAGEIGTWTGPAGVTFSPNEHVPNATANNLNLGANVLTWTITDAGFVCTGSSDNITVTYSNVDMSGSADVVLPCFGATTATGTFTVTGGVAPFTYSILSNTSGATVALPPPGPTTSVSFTNGGAGIVRLQVQDNSGCTDQVTITITQPAAAVTATTTITNVTCNGGSNGSILITPAGGVAPYDFSINGGTSYPILDLATHTFTGLTAQNYNLRVRDANGCESAVIVRTVTQPTAIVPGATAAPVTCFGGNNGSITITPTGGVGPYDFSIDGGATYPILDGTTTTFNGLTANSYNVRVRDANNCESAVTPVVVNQPAAAVTAATTPTPVLCNGGNTGSILVTPSGGVGPYDFSIDGGASYPIADLANHTFTGLTANTYNIRVRDANNCETAVLPVIVTQPTVLAAATTPTHVTCFGAATGSIQVAPSGGVAPYDFSIDGGASFPVTDIATHTFTGLIAGTYNISVRDANNCIVAAAPVTITQPATGVTATTTPTGATCFNGSNGSILISPAGGVAPYDFSIDGGASYPIVDVATHTFTGLNAQNYNIRVRDANNCETAVIVTTVGQASEILFTPSVGGVTCFGGNNGSLTVTPTGGTGPYDFSIDGGASYGVLDATTNTFTGLTQGNYNLRVRDANNCESSIVVGTVTEPNQVILAGITITGSACSGVPNGTITLSESGGTGPYQYSINGGTSFQSSPFFGGLLSGTYDVIITDANSCSSPLYAGFVVNSGLVYDLSVSSTPASCGGVNDGTVTVNSTTGGTAPFEYSIDGGTFQSSATFTGIGVGNHSVTARDASGCLSNPFDVTVGSSVVITSTNTPSPVTVCLGSDGAINITGISGGTGPYDLSIDNGVSFPVTDVTSNNFTGLVAGTYNVVIRDNAGCLSVPASVTVAAPPGCVLNCLAFNVVTDVQSQRPTCNGGTDGVIALIVSGNPGNIQVSLIPSTAPPVILPSGSTFVFSNLSENNYQYSITDGVNVCVQSFTWSAINNVQATLTSSEDSPCFGVPAGSAIINATGSSVNEYFYSIDGTTWTGFVPGIEINSLPTGTYNIRIGGSVNDPCYDEVTVTIDELGTAPLDTVYVSPVNGFPAVSFPESPTATRVIGIEESGATPYEVRLELVDPYGITPNPPFIIDWTEVDENNPQSFIPQKQIDNLYAGEYQLQLRDALGCQRTYSVIVGLDERIFIPNIFTPNRSDDLNKNFFIRNLPESGSKLQITDRWGKEVYSSKNYNPETLWDGGDSPDGVYFYRLQIKGGKTYTGWVEILRGNKP